MRTKILNAERERKGECRFLEREKFSLGSLEQMR